MPMYAHDPKDRRVFDNGAIGYRTYHYFKSWARFEGVPCDDNVRRLVYITGEPDTFFSTPAAVRVKGKWVSGYVSMDSGAEEGTKEGPRFTATGKNKDLIPNARKLAKALLEGR